MAGDIGGRGGAKVYGDRPECWRCDRRGNCAGEYGLRGEDVRWVEVAVAPGVGRTCETEAESGRDSLNAELDRTEYQNKTDERLKRNGSHSRGIANSVNVNRAGVKYRSVWGIRVGDKNE